MVRKEILHYEIIEELGQGGMGVVYKAKDTKLNRNIAIKFLPSAIAANQTERQRLIIESQAAAALNHPNIATIHAIEEVDGELFIVMECIEGKEIKELISEASLDIQSIVTYALQIAKGLQIAHEKDVIHRDIKSANIMITDSGQIKIMDFGLAKIGDGADLTKDHSTVGTLAYMSPEQIQGQDIDHRTDIFSFGVVLFEMLTGRLPFYGDYESAMMYSILNEEPEDIEALRLDCPGYVVDVIGKCLQKNADDRFSSMAEIISILQDQKQTQKRFVALAKKDNLPVQLTSFVGRSQEIETIQNLIIENRLVTLTGAGGCGKTRLAMRVAEKIVHDFSDGVWLVELASLTEASQIDGAIAAIFQLKEQAGKTLLDILKIYLSDKQLLLLLDNCEHLIDGCSEISETLLKAVPNIKILATSREALNVPGELAWRVPSLSMPKEEIDDIEKLCSFEAIQLFTTRAQQASPSFQFNAQNAETVVDICKRLDGIPLAIELAASRIRLLQPQAILDRLDDRFRLLTGGSRTALERHKTLRATIDWSYDLLSEKEKVLFRRLSVFVGGCEMEAAEKICGGDSLDEFEIIDLFTGLVDKSLVVTTTQQDGTNRYRLLETIRHYANQKLLESGEVEEIRQRHFDFYLDLAEEAFVKHVDEFIFWKIRVTLELDNFKAATDWIENNEKRLQLVGALGWFWYEGAHPATGLKYLKECKKVENYENMYVARAASYFGFLNFLAGNMDGMVIVEQTIKFWDNYPDTFEKAAVFHSYSAFQSFMGNYRVAIEKALKMIKIGENLGNKALYIMGKTCEGFAYICQNKPELAESIMEQNLKDSIATNNLRMKALNLHQFADCSLEMGQHKITEKRYAEALKGMAETNYKIGVFAELTGIAFALGGQKRYLKAVRLRGFIEKSYAEFGMVVPPVKFWQDAIKAYLDSSVVALGNEKAERALQEGREMDIEQAVEYALEFDRD